MTCVRLNHAWLSRIATVICQPLFTIGNNAHVSRDVLTIGKIRLRQRLAFIAKKHRKTLRGSTAATPNEAMCLPLW